MSFCGHYVGIATEGAGSLLTLRNEMVLCCYDWWPALRTNAVRLPSVATMTPSVAEW